jgi:hypothetical protein
VCAGGLLCEPYAVRLILPVCGSGACRIYVCGTLQTVGVPVLYVGACVCSDGDQKHQRFPHAMADGTSAKAHRMALGPLQWFGALAPREARDDPSSPRQVAAVGHPVFPSAIRAVGVNVRALA